MSRTDKDVPYFVQAVRYGEVDHDHRFFACSGDPVSMRPSDVVRSYKKHDCPKVVRKTIDCYHSDADKQEYRRIVRAANIGDFFSVVRTRLEIRSKFPESCVENINEDHHQEVRYFIDRTVWCDQCDHARCTYEIYSSLRYICRCSWCFPAIKEKSKRKRVRRDMKSLVKQYNAGEDLDDDDRLW